MSDMDSIDWDNLSFADLDRLSDADIPVEHLERFLGLITLRNQMQLDGVSNSELAAMTGQAVSTIYNKQNMKTKWSLADFVLLNALSNISLEDRSALAKMGRSAKINVAKFMSALK